MSKLEELIQELCPNGVKYRTVGDICNICRGVVMSKDFIRDNVGAYPVYSSQTENNGELGKINTYSFDGEYLTWTTDGANAGSVFYRNGKFSVTNVCGVLEMKDNDISAKFLFYVLQTSVKPYVNKGMGNPKLMSNVMARVKVPVPPIEVQEEIVRILDKFTKLTAELTARQKQYEYYRNELLNVESRIKNVELKRLGDVCNIGDGLHGTPEYDENGEVYFINGNNVKGGKIQFDNNTKKINNMEYQKLRLPFDNNTLFLSINGTIGNVAIYRNERIALGKSVAYFNIITDKLNRKYLFYILQSAKAQIYFKNSVTGGTIKNLGLKALREFQIQIPPLEEQKRIVAILDHFDKLCNDISEGLPAEIEARQKQYEYYRDKLLTFEEIAQ